MTTQTTLQKSSITQRLRTDLGRSVGVTTATQLVWLTGLRAQPSHFPQQPCKEALLLVLYYLVNIQFSWFYSCKCVNFRIKQPFYLQISISGCAARIVCSVVPNTNIDGNHFPDCVKYKKRVIARCCMQTSISDDGEKTDDLLTSFWCLVRPVVGLKQHKSSSSPVENKKFLTHCSCLGYDIIFTVSIAC